MRYDIEEKDRINGDTRVFVVTPTRQFAGRLVHHSTQVWVNGVPRCVKCSGPLVAMRADCPHARAVKRHLARTE